mgnify:CR=1 FL=1|tara:strand:+ start:707 stop:940 length:234 start_codon:yes stop_codon:yes gene_type:complete
MSEKTKQAKKKAPAKKKAAPKKEQPLKATRGGYRVCLFKPGGAMVEHPQGGEFATKADAQSYIDANPQWPQLATRKN